MLFVSFPQAPNWTTSHSNNFIPAKYIFEVLITFFQDENSVVMFTSVLDNNGQSTGLSAKQFRLIAKAQVYFDEP